MAILGFEFEDIARLIALMEAQGLEELIIEEDGRYLRLRGRQPLETYAIRQEPVQQRPDPAPNPPLKIAPPARAQSQPATSLAHDQVALISPMVGVFYRAEKPGAPPLVHVGDHVAVDQTVGVIEAMKVFSEFKAEHAGTIVAIPAGDGQLVQTGAPLFILKPD